MIKTLLCSDLHLHTWKSFGLDLKTKLPRRLFEQQQALNQIIQIIDEQKIKRVIIGGDLFHKVGEIPVEALNICKLFFDQLKSRDLEIFVVKGNHDLIDRETPEWFENSVDIFSSTSKTPENIKLVDFNEVVDYNSIEGYDLVVLHKTPIGSKINNYEFTEGVDWKTLAANNKLVAFGHIHETQTLSDNCFVIGASMHLTFGDNGDRGVWILEDGKCNFIKLDCPEFKTVETEDEVPWDDTYNYYRILNAKEKSVNSNVVSVIKPKYFEERIKTDNFQDILNEWLVFNEKNNSYLELIKPILLEKTQMAKTVFGGRLSGVIIKDFMSVGEIKYKLTNGLTIIKGKNEDNNSNGAGKTSILDAIYWCLFGKTTKGLTGDDVIRRGKEDCGVAVGLIEGSTRIKVFRNRKDGLQVWVENENGCTEVTEGLKVVDRQKMLEDQILGFNADVFLAACYFSQENLQMLTGLSDSDKTNMVTNLLGFEQYDDLQEEVKKEIKQIEDNERQYTKTGDELETTIKISESNLAFLTQREQSLISKIAENNLTKQEHIKTIETLKASTPLLRPILNENYQESIKKVEEEIIKQNKTIEEFDIGINKVNSQLTEEAIKTSDINSTISNFMSNIADLNNQITRLEKLDPTEKCDKCGSKITENKINNFKKEKLDAIKEIDITVGQLEKTNQLTLIKKVELELILQEKQKGKQLVIKYIQELNNLIKIKNQELLKQTQDIAYNEKIGTEIATNINMYQTQITNIDNQITSLNQEITQLKNDQTGLLQKITNTKEELSKIAEVIEGSKNNLGILEFWKNAFSNKGIRPLLLDKFCNEFNTIINQYMVFISNNKMSVLINPISTIKSGEERNKINFNITIDGVDCKYESLSGGEKRRIETALCLSLNKWVSNKYKVPNGLLGILILDELFSYIDKEGEESIGSLLYNEGTNKTIFVVSHTPSLDSFTPNIWNVIKTGGTSRLEIET